jgi:hypothetical protein
MVTIGDGLTQGMKVIGHALHPMIVVPNVEVTLLEDAEPIVELQNVGLMVAKELGLEREPRLTSGIQRFPNGVVEFEEEGTEDPCHQDVFQPSPIYGRIGDVREDVIVHGVSTKCEKHEVAPPLVVGRREFQNDRNRRSYVLDVGSLHLQMRGEGGVRADVDGAIIVVVLGDNDPLCSVDQLFQVMSDDLLLHPNEGDGTLARMGLVQGLACGSHDGDESLLLSHRGSSRGLSCGHGGVHLSLSGSGGGLVLINREVESAARHGRQDDGG